MKLALKKGVTREDVLDGIDATVITYMMGRRSIGEAAMRKLIHEHQEIRDSYFRKIERIVARLIDDGIPAAFFGRKA